jgi:hypothetical protein
MRQLARMLPLDTAQPHRQKTADSDSHLHSLPPSDGCTGQSHSLGQFNMTHTGVTRECVKDRCLDTIYVHVSIPAFR